MNDLLLFLVTIIPLLGYIAKDIGARLEEGTAHETRRRVATVSAMVVLYSMALTAIVSEVSSSVPWGLLQGSALFIIQPASTIILIIVASDSFGAARDTSRREAHKMKVADYIDQQLAGRLKPLEGAILGVQNGLSEVSALKPKVEEMSESVDALAATVSSQAEAANEIAEQYQMREASYRDIAVQYEKWYSKRAEADLALKDLILEADDMLTRCYIVMDEMDDFIDLVEPEPPVPGMAAKTEAGAPQGQTANPPISGETPPVIHGKLTKLQGMANRERGNKAQLKFAEEVLRGAGKLYDNSIREGTPDYIFWAPGSLESRKAKAVGAFKALTLREDGTRQRHIPRRKVLAELRTATKYAVPMILFVMNFTNGRIWAKVIPVNELKDFPGQTTPPMLVEGDPQAEKTCKETLQMALNLL